MWVAADCKQEEQGDAGRGKRRRKAVLTPQQLASALDGGRRSGSSSGSDFAAAAAEAAAGAETESEGGTDSDVVSEGGADEQPVEEPDDILEDDDLGSARPKAAAKRCAPASNAACINAYMFALSSLPGAVAICIPHGAKILTDVSVGLTYDCPDAGRNEWVGSLAKPRRTQRQTCCSSRSCKR